MKVKLGLYMLKKAIAESDSSSLTPKTSLNFLFAYLKVKVNFCPNVVKIPGYLDLEIHQQVVFKCLALNCCDWGPQAYWESQAD